MDKAAIGCTTTYCGHQGLLSNYGVTPPYLGAVISERITFSSNNVFRNNTYTGDWRFTVYDQGRHVDWATWRASPYNQDAGSTRNGAAPPPTTTTTPSTSSTAPRVTTSTTSSASSTSSTSSSSGDATTTTALSPDNHLDDDTASPEHPWWHWWHWWW